MGATETIAQWVVNTSYEDIPPEALRAAKETQFDCLGLMLAGSTEELGQIIQKYVSTQGGPQEATVLGSGLKTSMPHAALANGTMGMAMDYDPEPQMMAIVAALLAIAEKTGSSERDLLAALIVGAELGWAIGHTPWDEMEDRGLHGQGVQGGIAVAAACANLLNLDQHQTTMAMGMAASMGGGLLQSEGSMTKPMFAGLSARDGLVSAQLAALGFTAGDQLFDSPSGFSGISITAGAYDFSELAAHLGNPYRIQEFKYVRQYPCCRGNHGALDSILGLMREEKFNYGDVERVEIEQSYRSLVMRFDRPENEHQARFSIRFNLAAALVDGKVGVETFRESKINDPQVQEAMNKVHINVQTQWEAGGGDSHAPSPVTVHLKDGRQLMRSTSRDQILGSASNPFGLDFIVEKFRQNVSMALPKARADQAVEAWSPTAQVEDIAKAVKTLVADGQ